MKKLFLIAAVPVLFAACNSGDTKDTNKDTAQMGVKTDTVMSNNTSGMQNDADFAAFAADANMAEVQLAKLAATNASGKAVKDLAKMLIDDHQKAQAELSGLATQYSISLPATMSEKHKQKYDELSAKKGTEFDKAYLDAMKKGHEEVISRFEQQANNGSNTALKDWASGKLPALRHHLEVTMDAMKATNNNNMAAL